MEKLKKNTTYYVGKPFKDAKNFRIWVYGQFVVNIDSNLKQHTQMRYSAKAKDFSDGFMGFGVSERAICISPIEFERLKKNTLTVK